MFGLFESKPKAASLAGKEAILLFDIGGTKMRVAASVDGVTFGEPKIGATPLEFEEGMDAFQSLAKSVLLGAKAKIAVGASAGILSKDKRSFFRMPNLPKWQGKNLAEEMEKRLGCSVYLENDAALGGLGEATAGAGNGAPILVYFTVSTGVGGARIVNGKIDARVASFEPGHQIMDRATGEELEEVVSGTAVKKRFKVNPWELSDLASREELADELAYGLYNSVLHWSPDVVVLGGSMIVGVNEIPINRIEQTLKRLLTYFPEGPELRKAKLGDVGGLHGALAYAKQVLEKPTA